MKRPGLPPRGVPLFDFVAAAAIVGILTVTLASGVATGFIAGILFRATAG